MDVGARALRLLRRKVLYGLDRRARFGLVRVAWRILDLVDRRRMVLFRVPGMVASGSGTGTVPVRKDCERGMRLQAKESVCIASGPTRATFAPRVDTPATR